ncbi:MAG: PAS domain S-box protein, partial [Chloroflexi bacterium]
MQKSQVNLQAYLNNTSVLIVIIDCQGNIVEFNSACEKTSGYT